MCTSPTCSCGKKFSRTTGPKSSVEGGVATGTGVGLSLAAILEDRSPELFVSLCQFADVEKKQMKDAVGFVTKE